MRPGVCPRPDCQARAATKASRAAPKIFGNLAPLGITGVRDRLIAPGLAIAAFTVTLGIGAWHWQRPKAPDAFVQAVSPAVQARALAPTQSTEPVSGAPGPAPESPAQSADAEAAARQPTPPDPAALPSYEEDQIARSADAERGARSR